MRISSATKSFEHWSNPGPCRGWLLGATARVQYHGCGELISTCIGVAGFVSTAVYDAVAGLAVIFRVLSRKIIIESGSLGPLLVLLALAILVLSRLISNYHRSSATE